MTTTIKDEFMQQIATEQAWKDLSENLAWTESLLEKYSDKVDWKEISENRHIIWTVPMLQKFSKKIDWKALSENIEEDWFTKAHLEAFKDKWDWSKIAANVTFSEELIDQYIDYIDWSAVLNLGHYSDLISSSGFDAIAFYEKYKEHLPVSKLQESALWDKMVEQVTGKIKADILS